MTLKKRIKKTFKYKKWRKKVCEKFNYKCYLCGAKDELEAHHVIPLSQLLKYFIESCKDLIRLKSCRKIMIKALNYKPFWDVANGVCLCSGCHKEQHF